MKSLRIEVKRLSFFNDVITEKANPEGYKIPVTVNVTRQGDEATTRAVYDSENKKLTFGWGDLLFVNGTHATAGKFAGTLDWQPGGTFTGNLSIQYEYSGTADALLSGATTVEATLLPDGYNNCKFLVNTNALVGHGSHTHAAASAARNYKYAPTAEAGAHPTGTSAWFLPSTGQWVKMIAAMDGNTALRDGFSSVGGTNMQSAYYWSSTEYNANSAWLYNLPFNNFSSEDKYGTVSYVRPCLAF